MENIANGGIFISVLINTHIIYRMVARAPNHPLSRRFDFCYWYCRWQPHTVSKKRHPFCDSENFVRCYCDFLSATHLGEVAMKCIAAHQTWLYAVKLHLVKLAWKQVSAPHSRHRGAFGSCCTAFYCRRPEALSSPIQWTIRSEMWYRNSSIARR